MFKTFLSTCRLTHLTVADCKFDCKNTLKTLIAHNLYLSALPDNINELSALNCINIAFNNLHWLPENFTLLKNLRICDASNNVLSYFPLNFLQLNSLSELYLAHNCLTVLPNLIELKNLRVLDLYNNSLETIDKQLIDSMLEIDFDLNYIEYDDCDLILKKKVRLRERLNLTRLDGQKSKPTPSIETNSVTSQSWEDHESDDYLEDDQIVEYIERDTKSESDVEIWDDVNYLDDNFLPSPISIQPRFEKLKLSSSPVYEYDLYEIFKDAD
ncbi:leucine-rich repeat-containing protein 40-like [Chrysoperla carnea]|uniref:leucine-rich repeat-containing protein 40-like n=1 Tax=Chrysoperla carnea TaxID=189513 RepID=UPI001D08C486|nr:leucine-rich repeat-containing protein 40-like [Chrysoperla carnea]